MYTFSKEHLDYLKKIRKEKLFVIFWRIFIIFTFFITWEIFADYKIINTFLFSSPSKVINTSINLIGNGELIKHISITLYEVLLSFLLSSFLGFLVAIILWNNKLFSKVMDPFITVLNSLPKVALGPLIIIWVGASINSIIFMALMISIFVTILTIYQGFISVNNNYVVMLKSFGASKWQIFRKIVLPNSLDSIMASLKINISMSLIGVIMGELLVSKNGLGYLIMYGSQVFQIDLVITSVFILGIISYVMYYLLHLMEILVVKKIIILF